MNDRVLLVNFECVQAVILAKVPAVEAARQRRIAKWR